jgi:hypothetical protein
MLASVTSSPIPTVLRVVLAVLVATIQLTAADVASKRYLGLNVPDKVLNQPVSNKLNIKVCGLHGKSRRCTVDSSAFNPLFLEGDVIDIDFGPKHRYTCRSNGRGSCSCVSLLRDGIMGDMNVVTRGANSQGESYIFGSTSVGGEICDFSPDATGSTLVVECTSESEYPAESDPSMEDDL